MANQKQSPKTLTFTQRRDFYWQYISYFAIILLIYGLLKGSLEEGTFSIAVDDPIVILLLVFIVVSGFALIVNFYKRRTILVGPDFIVFKSRFGEKKFQVKDILRISVGREKLFKVRRGTYRVIKIKLYTRKRLLRIRPSSFDNEAELVQSVSKLKRQLKR